MDNNELISDLIKIGVPSVVALAGTLSSLVLAWWGHKQNLFIKKIQYLHDTQKERDFRTGDLVKNCSLEINALHDDFVAFGIMLYAKVDTLACLDPWLEAEQEVIAERFQKTVQSLQKHTAVKSYVMLLGNDELSRLYQNYLGVVGQVVGIYSSDEVMSIADLNEFIDQANGMQLEIMKKMSCMYLIHGVEDLI